MSEAIENGSENLETVQNENLQELIAAEVAKKEVEIRKQYEGLVKNKDKILQEKKQVEEQLKAYDGLTPEQLQKFREMEANLQKDEHARLIAEGKWEDVLQSEVERRVQRLREDAEIRQKRLTEELEKARQEKEVVDRKRKELLIDNKLREAASRAGVIQEAVRNAVMDGKAIFDEDPETGQIVPRDADGNLMISKDGKRPLTMDEWAEELIKDCPHYFPQSVGGGSGGGITKNGRTYTEKQLANMTQEEYNRWASGNF